MKERYERWCPTQLRPSIALKVCADVNHAGRGIKLIQMQITDVQFRGDESAAFLRWNEMVSRFREISQSRSTFKLLNVDRNVGDDQRK